MSICCKQCGADVVWTKESGRWHCHNPDGSDHWDLCSKRRWRQVKATGERFETERESGYANSIHGTKLDRLSAKPIRGAGFKLSGECKDCVAPWEVCAALPNGCPDAI